MSEARLLLPLNALMVWTGKTFFCLPDYMVSEHWRLQYKQSGQLTWNVMSPSSMVTGYLVPAIKSQDGYKDVSLILTAPGCLNRHTL